MDYVGKAMRDKCVQEAYGILCKRGYLHPINSCYYKLLGILDREGYNALIKYVEETKI